MKRPITLIAFLFTVLVSSCEKETVSPPDPVFISDTSAVTSLRCGKSPKVKYEFMVFEMVPCNMVLFPANDYRLFYSGCVPDPNDNSIVDLKVWYREYVWTYCINGSPVMPNGFGWVLDSTACTATGGRCKWVRDPLITPPVNDVQIGSCINFTPIEPFTSPVNCWHLIFEDCANSRTLWWDWQI